MSRTKKATAGRILFVGAGPGNPDLLTTRARTVITGATTAYIDPDVPAAVVSLIGIDHADPEPARKSRTVASKSDAAKSDAATADASNSDTSTSDASSADASSADGASTENADSPTDTHGASDAAANGPTDGDAEEQSVVRPALGDPSEVAKTLIAAAKAGEDVVRVVSGDPLTTDAVVAEVSAVARSVVHFEVIPGLPAASVVPSYAGMPLGSSHTEADVRGEVDWAALAAAPGPLVLHASATHLAETASALTEHGMAPQTPVAITINGTTCAQRTIEATLATLNEQGNALTGPLMLTIGKVVGERGKLSWWESRALYGWTVLVPRTKDQAGDMSERLVSHGAIPKEVPTIAVEPPRSPAQMERAVKGLVDGRYQWVVFTSTNAVRAVWEKFAEFGLDARAFSGVKIACVGEATAERVRSFGINPELVPSGEQSSQGLLDDFPPYDDVFDPVNRILLPRADIATETLSEGLRERGWEIDDVTAYRTVRAAPPPAETREMIKTGGFDAVCFTSSSTVRNLVGIAGKPHARTIVACIGPKTAETATEFGLRVDVQPETASVPDLVNALAEHAARLRAEGALPPPRKKSRRSRS